MENGRHKELVDVTIMLNQTVKQISSFDDVLFLEYKGIVRFLTFILHFFLQKYLYLFHIEII
jgi:hypothetical protein